MHQIQDVLYVCNEKIQLHKEGRAAIACVDGGEKIHIPLCSVGQIVSFSYHPATCDFLELCAREGIGFSAVRSNGRLRFRVVGQTHGNVFLRREQYRQMDNPKDAFPLAKTIICNKLENSLRNIQRFLYDHPHAVSLRENKAALEALMPLLDVCHHADRLRGIEGQGAHLYFCAFEKMLLNEQPEFSFCGRNRRPPKDPVNALLSFAYAYLTQEYEAATDAIGLDPYVGCFHTERCGKPSLCLDLMEETRAMIADRFVLRLVNLHIVQGHHFAFGEEGEVHLNEEGRKLFSAEWNKMRRKEIFIAGVEKKIPIGLVPYIQAQRMSRYLLGEDAKYEPLKRR